jgi:undecaprenyl-diphosphatase
MLALFALELGSFGLGVFMVLWALSVGLSRVMTGMHYLSDIIAGILLGLGGGGLILLARPWMESLLPFLF